MGPILVFGKNGQLGSELSARAAQAGIAIICLGRAEADITNAKGVKSAIAEASPALVVNAAAYTAVDRAEAQRDEAFHVNAVGPGIIAQACSMAKIPLVHVSTDYVFDGTKPTAYSEEDTIFPLGVYGKSKAAGELAVREAHVQHIIMRTSWVYSTYGTNFLKTIVRLAGERPELRVVADQYGCPTATIDIADAILRAAPQLLGAQNLWGTYHFAGNGTASWHSFALEIVDAQAEITHRRPEVIAITTAEYPTPAKRPANSVLDSSRFAEVFGFRAADWRKRTREVVSTLFGQHGGKR